MVKITGRSSLARDTESGRIRKALDAIQNALYGLFLREEAALSADPPDPPEGAYAIWVSDGTDSGSAGDLMVKITINGTTTTSSFDLTPA